MPALMKGSINTGENHITSPERAKARKANRSSQSPFLEGIEEPT
jgi:hypothetical protein